MRSYGTLMQNIIAAATTNQMFLKEHAATSLKTTGVLLFSWLFRTTGDTEKHCDSPCLCAPVVLKKFLIEQLFKRNTRTALSRFF